MDPEAIERALASVTAAYQTVVESLTKEVRRLSQQLEEQTAMETEFNNILRSQILRGQENAVANQQLAMQAATAAHTEAVSRLSQLGVGEAAAQRMIGGAGLAATTSDNSAGVGSGIATLSASVAAAIAGAQQAYKGAHQTPPVGS